jgi:hypothetical protein
MNVIARWSIHVAHAAVQKIAIHGRLRGRQVSSTDRAYRGNQSAAPHYTYSMLDLPKAIKLLLGLYPAPHMKRAKPPLHRPSRDD